MSFYDDLPLPQSGVDTNQASTTTAWNASQKTMAPVQRKPPAKVALAMPRSAKKPPPATASSTASSTSTSATPSMVSTAGLKPPPQRPQPSSAKLSTGNFLS